MTRFFCPYSSNGEKKDGVDLMTDNKVIRDKKDPKKKYEYT